MQPTDRYTPGRELHLGCVALPLPALDEHPPIDRSRSNALLAAALAQLQSPLEHALSRFGRERRRSDATAFPLPEGPPPFNGPSPGGRFSPAD